MLCLTWSAQNPAHMCWHGVSELYFPQSTNITEPSSLVDYLAVVVVNTKQVENPAKHTWITLSAFVTIRRSWSQKKVIGQPYISTGVTGKHSETTVMNVISALSDAKIDIGVDAHIDTVLLGQTHVVPLCHWADTSNIGHGIFVILLFMHSTGWCIHRSRPRTRCWNS